MASDVPEIIFERKPDRTERSLRIGCGSLVGIALTVALGIRLAPTTVLFIVLFVVLVVLCACLAVRYGDRFFYEVLRWLPWV
jgi:uncharacterized membrane protein YccC